MAYVAGELTVGLYAEVARFQRDMQAASRSLNRLGQEAQAAQTEVSFLDKAMKTAAVSAGALVATTGVLAKRSFMAAASVAEMDTAMGAIEKSSGLAAGALSATANEVRAKGIEMRSAQEIAVLFAKAELDLADASKVARAAQDLAVISQSNSTATAMRLTYAIQTGNSQLLRSVGIQKYASEAYEDYAQSIGKATGNLTQQERQQAITNMVLEEAAKVAGAYTAAMLEPGKVLRSFPRLLNDMQIAFGDVLLEGFGPVIKASYDFTKQVSLAVREGGYFAPMLDEMRMAVTAALEPLSKFIYGLAASLKELNESKISVDGLAESFQKFLPVIAGVATALSTFAGSSLIRMIPGLNKLTALTNVRSPLLLGFGVLVATSDELRGVFIKLVKALEPSIVALGRVGEALADELVVAAEALVPLMVGMIEAAIPLVEMFGELAEFVTRSEVALKALTMVVAAYLIQTRLLNVQMGQSLVGAFGKLSTSVLKMRHDFAMAKWEIVATGKATTAFGVSARAGFAMAATAAKGFIAALGPLALATAAVWAITEAFSAWNNRNADAKARMEELTPRIEEMVQAFIHGEEAAEGLTGALDLLGRVLLDETAEGGKKTADALREFGVVGADAEQAAARMHTEFNQLALDLLEARGVTGDLAQEMVLLVNAFDNQGTVLRNAQLRGYTAEQRQLVMALEELQGQAENSEEALEQLAKTAQLEALALGALSSEMNSHILELIAGGDHQEAYAVAIGEVNRVLEEQAYWEQMASDIEAGRAAHLERLIFLNETYAERLGHVVDESVQLVSVSYAQERALRQTASAFNRFNDQVANVDKETASLAAIGDEFVDVLIEERQRLTELGKSTEQVNATLQLAAVNFMETAKMAGYSETEIAELANSLLVLDSIDPSIDIDMGLSTEVIQKQIAAIRGRVSALRQRVGGLQDTGAASALRAAEDTLEALSVFESISDDFGDAGRPLREGIKQLGSVASKTSEELREVANAYRAIVNELLTSDFAITNAEVLLEALRDRALEVAQAFHEMSDAQRLQAFHGQLQNVLSMMTDLAASGAGMSEINHFVEELIGPNGALAVFAQSAGISAEDYASAVAAIQGFQFQLGQELEWAEATAGMTPEEKQQFSDYLLGMQAAGAVPPSPEFGMATISSGGTTNITVNLPPGVSGAEVVDALADYALTEGATIPAPFQFVNLGG